MVYFYTGKNFRRENIYIDIFYYNDVLDYIYMKKPEFDVVEVKSLTKETLDTLGEEKIKANRKWVKTPSLLNKMFGELTYPEAHKKMFMAIANGEVNSKLEWLKKTNPDFDPYYRKLENDCFACTEAIRREAEVETQDIRNAFSMLAYHSFSDTYCKYCPLGGIGDSKMCLNGLYGKFFNAKGFEKFKLAYEIANLDWKEKE